MDLTALSSTEVQSWIHEHLSQNAYDLALKKPPFSDISMGDLVQQVQGWQVAKRKFPKLFDDTECLFPPKLNLEQTSSAATASYKSQHIKGQEIVDITGGFGIDCLYFAQSFKKVYHIERIEELQAIVAHNTKKLKVTNIVSYAADGIEFLNLHPEINDILYVDPARRNPNQKKVFLLEDLSPNILDYIQIWNERFNEVWIKLSPIIDIHYLIKTIPELSQIHLVAVKNELKEVLIQTKKNPLQQLIAINLETAQNPWSVDWFASYPTPMYSEVSDYIYEPNAPIQKSGFIDILATQFDVAKLHPNSQLFTSDHFYPNFPGRVYKIVDLIKNPKKALKGKSIQAIHRNFPEPLAQLKKKYRFSTDGNDPIIFTQTLNQVLILEAEQMT
ncbi:MAG: hypothetical protein ACR2MS_08845 [Weeksellaceae bacterium]